MKELNTQQIKEMLLFTADKIIEAKPVLTEVDSAIGDGDHGIGMETGMKKAKQKLEQMDAGKDVFALFHIMGKTMLMSMGGASGVIFGSMFLAGAKNEQPARTMSAEQLAGLFERSLDAIRERGKASVGDKTMVDALSPAVEAMNQVLEEALKEGKEADVEVLLKKAADGAGEGMENTRNLEAKFGRAKTQGTTIGYRDAGATSVWIIFQAMSDYVLEWKGSMRQWRL